MMLTDEQIDALRTRIGEDEGDNDVTGTEVDALFAQAREANALRARLAELEPVPDSVRFYYMHDNHTFTRLFGTSLDEIVEAANKVESASSYGMLCGAILMRKEKEFRRVGVGAHSYASTDSKDKWNAGIAAWRKSLESDPDVMRLLHTNAARGVK